MKRGRALFHTSEPGGHVPAHKTQPAPPAARRKRHRGWRWFAVVLLVLAGLAGIGRILLPWAVRDYVNRTLDRSPLYDGRIGEVRIHLWRGAYSIDHLRINKVTGDVPVPFFWPSAWTSPCNGRRCCIGESWASLLWSSRR